MLIKKSIKYSFTLLILGALSARGQKEIISENQDLLWTRYHLTTHFSDRWKWVNEADNRLFLSSFHRAQFIGHTHVHRALGKNTEASIGFTYSNVNPPEPFETNPKSTSEYRPFQEFYFKQGMNHDRVKLQHRFRSEERFFDPTDGVTNFNWRFRYQLALSYSINRVIEAKANEEIFINAGKNIIYNPFDASRLYGALAFKIGKPLTFEAGYLRSVQQLSSGNQFLKRDNIRLTLFHQISPNS